MPSRGRRIAGALLVALAGTALTVSPITADARAASAQDRANVSTRTLGLSSEGRNIDLITLSSSPENADSRPALLVVAGIDATHLSGIRVARQLAGRLASERADLLSDYTVYIVPLVNPDAAARATRVPIGAYDLRLTPKPIDHDRDRRMNEDGPNDLNGDGVITQMRVRNPAPGSGLAATHVEHEDDPRLMRPADRSKGETPVFAVMTEGLDDDNDGSVAEDPEGGIDLSRHFPYLWDEFDAVTGDYPLEDPGARALADWMLTRPNLVAVLTYGPHDTLSSIPADGKYDDTRRVPLGIESDDKRAYEQVSEAFVDATGLKTAEGRSNEGSFHGWSYAHLGLYSFSTPLWSVPDTDSDDTEAPAPATDNAGEAEDADTPAGPTMAEIQEMIRIYESGSAEEQEELMKEFNAMPAETQARIMAIASGQPDPLADAAAPEPPASSPRKRSSDINASWIAYADERGEGFVDWQTFDHPQFGEVEIGGFVPGFRLNAPADRIETIADAQVDFIASLLGMFPAIEVGEPRVKSLGSGVYEVAMRISNTGALPSRPAISEKTRRWPPILIRPQIAHDLVLVGDPIERIDRLEPGQQVDLVWTVRSSDPTLDITITIPESGERSVSIDLSEGN